MTGQYDVQKIDLARCIRVRSLLAPRGFVAVDIFAGSYLDDLSSAMALAAGTVLAHFG